MSVLHAYLDNIKLQCEFQYSLRKPDIYTDKFLHYHRLSLAVATDTHQLLHYILSYYIILFMPYHITLYYMMMLYIFFFFCHCPQCNKTLAPPFPTETETLSQHIVFFGGEMSTFCSSFCFSCRRKSRHVYERR